VIATGGETDDEYFAQGGPYCWSVTLSSGIANDRVALAMNESRYQASALIDPAGVKSCMSVFHGLEPFP
jgi:hypothetical protein